MLWSPPTAPRRRRGAGIVRAGRLLIAAAGTVGWAVRDGDLARWAAPAAATALPTVTVQVLELWLFGRSPHTQRAYRREATRFLARPTLAGKPLRQVTLGDVQAPATALANPAAPLGPPSQARALAAVKSLLAFGHRLGYLSFDVGGALRLPKLKNALAERILSEVDVHRPLALERRPRASMPPVSGGLNGSPGHLARLLTTRRNQKRARWRRSRPGGRSRRPCARPHRNAGFRRSRSSSSTPSWVRYARPRQRRLASGPPRPLRESS